jgi:NAD(P)-dependent dehydrogenase (short-subunit alcohol dehydrogenase family)
MGKLDGQNALVTGASRGIGRGIAEELAREGANVVVNYRRDEAAAAETVAAIRAMGREAVAIQADVAEWDQVAAMADKALSALGRWRSSSPIPGRLEVNSVWDMDVDHWHKVVGVNLHSVFTCEATADFGRSQKARSSFLVDRADTCFIGAPYYVEAGVALTKSLAGCAPAGVRVHCIAPAWSPAIWGPPDEVLRRALLAAHPSRPAGADPADRQDGRLSGIGRRQFHHRQDHPHRRRRLHVTKQSAVSEASQSGRLSFSLGTAVTPAR